MEDNSLNFFSQQESAMRCKLKIWESNNAKLLDIITDMDLKFEDHVGHIWLEANEINCPKKNDRVCSTDISNYLYFLRISKVSSMLHYGSVGRVHSKECYFVFTYTYLHILLDILLLLLLLLLLLFCFSSKKLCFYHFHFCFWWIITFLQQNINQSEGLKTDLKNFRPISLLPLISKIIERIIHDQIMNFLLDNNVLYKYQSGFRKFHSTDTCSSYLHDKITKGFDSGLLTGMVLIDLQKAFDTIGHNILILKKAFSRFYWDNQVVHIISLK